MGKKTNEEELAELHAMLGALGAELNPRVRTVPVMDNSRLEKVEARIEEHDAQLRKLAEPAKTFWQRWFRNY